MPTERDSSEIHLLAVQDQIARVWVQGAELLPLKASLSVSRPLETAGRRPSHVVVRVPDLVELSAKYR